MVPGRAQELWSNLASATANGTGVPQSLLDVKAAEVQKRTEAQRLIEVTHCVHISGRCMCSPRRHLPVLRYVSMLITGRHTQILGHSKRSSLPDRDV